MHFCKVSWLLFLPRDAQQSAVIIIYILIIIIIVLITIWNANSTFR